MGLEHSLIIILCCLLIAAGGKSLCHAADEYPVIEFGRVKLKTDRGKSPNVLYGLANNDAKVACLSVDFAFDTEELDKIETSCSCSEVISVEKKEDHASVMVKVDLPFSDGKQLFHLNLFNKKGIAFAAQEICLFKGQAKCLLSRFQAKLEEFDAASTVEIPVRLLGAESIEKIEVKIENERMNGIISASKINHAQGVFSINIQLENPAVGVIWIVITCNGETFKSPFLIVK